MSLIYNINVGNYKGSHLIYLYFDPHWKLVDGEDYLPVEGNLQPFKVTLEQAREIAINAGFSVDPYGVNGSIFCYHGSRDSPTVYQGKYVWSINTWVDPPGSNPRKNIAAIIDPNTGELLKYWRIPEVKQVKDYKIAGVENEEVLALIDSGVLDSLIPEMFERMDRAYDRSKLREHPDPDMIDEINRFLIHLRKSKIGN